ncbi:hypothetical protein D3C81_211790 [compost metagenome]
MAQQRAKWTVSLKAETSCKGVQLTPEIRRTENTGIMTLKNRRTESPGPMTQKTCCKEVMRG